MAFVWLLPAALHSGAPVGLSLVDRGVVFQMQLHGAHVALISRCGAERHSSVPAALDCFCGVGRGRWQPHIDHCRPPQEKLHGIRVVVTGCLAQRRSRQS